MSTSALAWERRRAQWAEDRALLLKLSGYELRRASGGHLAHAVPVEASWSDGKALCGFRPSSDPDSQMAGRGRWVCLGKGMACSGCVRKAQTANGDLESSRGES